MKDKLQDKKMMLESYCEMSAEEKQAYLAENNKERYADQINQYCTLDEEGKKAYLDQVKEQYRDKELRDKLKDKKMVLEAYCEMSDADKEAYITENGKEKYADQINKYCTLDDDGKAAYLDMVKEQYRDKGSKDRMMEKIKDKKMMLESYCEMSDADRQSFIKENNKEKYQDKLNEYCSLDDDGKKAFIADLKEQYRDKQASDKAKANLQDKKAKLESYCEMSDADRQAYITENGKERYQDKLNEYCTLDMDGKKAYFDELKSQYRGYYDSKGSAAHVASEMSSIKSELDGLSGLDSADKETLRQDIISRAMSMQLGWVTPAGGDDAAVQDAAGCDEESVLVTYASSGEQACVVYEDSIDLIDSGAATLAN